MTKPAKSDEIEDVLSSIRRLVSEHQPPAAPAPAGANAGSGDRLVLTAALRVTDPEDPWVPVSPRIARNDDGTGGDGTDPASTDRESTDPEREAGAEWADNAWGEAAGHHPGPDSAAETDPQLLADQWESAPKPEDIPVEPPADPQLEADEWSAGSRPGLDGDPQEVAESRDTEIRGTEIRGTGPETSETPDAEPEILESAAIDRGRAATVLAEMDKGADGGEFEQELGASGWPDDFARAAALELAAARAAMAAERGVAADAGEPPAQEDLPEAGSDDRAGGDQEAEITARAAVALATGADDDTAADTSGERPETTADIARQGDHEPGRDDTLHMRDAGSDDGILDFDVTDGFEVEDLGESPFAFPDGDFGTLDEDTLREIIAEVVREELQGVLGQRITRNVRKLVRREIRIALAAEDLD